jgi:hypothetical protein
LPYSHSAFPQHEPSRKELRHGVRFRLIAAQAFDLVRQQFEKQFVLLVYQVLPSGRKSCFRLSFSADTLIILPGICKCLSGTYRIVSQIAPEPPLTFIEVSFHKVKLVHTPLLIIALLGRQVEVPLLPVGEYGHGNAGVESVLEKLTIRARAAARLLHFDEDDGAVTRVAERVIHTPAFEREFGCDYLWAEYRPVKSIQQGQHYTVADRSFIYEVTAAKSISGSGDVLAQVH